MMRVYVCVLSGWGHAGIIVFICLFMFFVWVLGPPISYRYWLIRDHQGSGERGGHQREQQEMFFWKLPGSKEERFKILLQAFQI